MSRIIAVCSQKGGVGKSSLTVNIGVGLARLGQKVLIVDADPQSDASASLGLRDMDESDETLSELIAKTMADETLPEGLFIQHQEEGVDILPSNIGLAGVEVQMINIMSREFILKQIISNVSDEYDVILIDNMPSLGMLTVNSLAVADEVLVPVEASYLPIKGLQQLLKTVGKVRKQINTKLQIGGIVFNMVDSRTREHRENMKLLRDSYGSQLNIFETTIPFSIRVKECGKAGESIYRYDAKGKAAAAFEQLAGEVLAYGS
jgi:chromosome partitioning protein